MFQVENGWWVIACTLKTVYLSITKNTLFVWVIFWTKRAFGEDFKVIEFIVDGSPQKQQPHSRPHLKGLEEIHAPCDSEKISKLRDVDRSSEIGEGVSTFSIHFIPTRNMTSSKGGNHGSPDLLPLEQVWNIKDLEVFDGWICISNIESSRYGIFKHTQNSTYISTFKMRSIHLLSMLCKDEDLIGV